MGLNEACREYLSNKGSTLWGRAFDINDGGGLERAVDWLAEQMRGVIALRQEHEVEPLPEYKGEEVLEEVSDDDNRSLAMA